MSVIDLFQVTFKAAHRIAKFSSVALGTAEDYGVTQAGSIAVGIAQRDANSGQSVPVMLHGISRGLVGAAVVRGSRVVQTTSGFIITATSGAAASTPILGKALTSAASGMIAHIFIQPSFNGNSGDAN